MHKLGNHVCDIVTDLTSLRTLKIQVSLRTNPWKLRIEASHRHVSRVGGPSLRFRPSPVDVTKGSDAATHMPEGSHLAGGDGPAAL